MQNKRGIKFLLKENRGIELVRIKEIFTSIQGEGPFIGYKQLFIRFCGCNLNCNYCDTDFNAENSKDYSIEELIEIEKQNLDCHSISLTGGEPLLQEIFLKEFLPQVNLPVYLETNGTLYKNLSSIINFIDIISMDIKLPSCTGLKPLWQEHEMFLESSKEKNIYVKVVFDKNVTEEELNKVCELSQKYNTELVLQPKMDGKIPSVDSNFMVSILEKCLKKYKRTRLIPQVHKFIDVI